METTTRRPQTLSPPVRNEEKRRLVMTSRFRFCPSPPFGRGSLGNWGVPQISASCPRKKRNGTTESQGQRLPNPIFSGGGWLSNTKRNELQSRSSTSVAFCSPAKGLTLSGLIRKTNSLVGKKLFSPNIPWQHAPRYYRALHKSHR